MDNFGVAELVSALEEEEEEGVRVVEGHSHGYDEDDLATTSIPHHPKTFPLKTSKQRSSNRKAKTAAAAAAASTPGLQQNKRSPRKEANSTDDEESTPAGLHKSPPRLQNNNNNNNNNNVIVGGPPQESFFDKPLKTSPGRTGGGCEMGDSDDNITERLSSTLSLHSDLLVNGPFESYPSSSTPTTASSSAKVLERGSVESDCFAEKARLGPFLLRQPQQPVPGPSSGCPGAMKFEGASPPPPHYSLRDLPPRGSHRRRRRRRGHVNSTKRMAVDNNSSPPPEVDMDEAGGSGRSKASPSYRKVVAHEEKKKKSGLLEGTLGVDRFGMKRKRNLLGCFSRIGLPHGNGVLSSSCPESSSGVGGGSDECCGVEDEEMKSDEDEDDSEYYSTSGDEDKDEDDRGREADDEQSDWVFDEWSANTSSASGGSGGDRSEGESAVCRRRRLMKMLRNYKSMISAGRDNTHNHQFPGEGKNGSLVSREILAGKRRVLSQPTTNFPASRSIWTSANEEVSKFLQDPKQSQIKLQPIPAEERVGLSRLASLYSLHMDYCSNDEGSQDRDLVSRVFPTCEKTEEDSMMVTEQQKLYPILTKTPNTTQMVENKGGGGLNGGSAGDFQGLFTPQEVAGSATSSGGGAVPPGETSNFHTSCSSSSFGALERSYCPTVSYSDVDSIASDTKRVKK